jgi:hypothetical protein
MKTAHAFPVLDDALFESGHALELKDPGMTLREEDRRAYEVSLETWNDLDAMARYFQWRWRYADAMLAAREGGAA